MTENQQRAEFILQKMITAVRDDEYFAEYLVEATLDELLDAYRMEDGFGTEGQCDPRGDGRDGDAYCVSGHMDGFIYNAALDEQDED